MGATAREVLVELTAVVGDDDDAGRILAEVLGVSFAALQLELAAEVPASLRGRALEMGGRRAGGSPLQHVLGTWGFRELDVVVDRRALVPRPETEQLVDIALEHLRSPDRAGSGGAGPIAVDLGAGSGVIALSLAHEGPSELEVWATERSAPALQLARCNLTRLAEIDPGGAARVHLGAGSWFEPLPERLRGRVDVVASNPPYVSQVEWEQLDPVVRDHDPKEALVAGPTGLEALDIVVDESVGWLVAGGALVVELAPWQTEVVRARAEASGYVDTRVLHDVAGRPRFLVARRRSA
jgi:release factor glutamine methyltransferase